MSYAVFSLSPVLTLQLLLMLLHISDPTPTYLHKVIISYCLFKLCLFLLLMFLLLFSDFPRHLCTILHSTTSCSFFNHSLFLVVNTVITQIRTTCHITFLCCWVPQPKCHITGRICCSCRGKVSQASKIPFCGECGCESGIFVIIIYIYNFGGCIIDSKQGKWPFQYLALSHWALLPPWILRKGDLVPGFFFCSELWVMCGTGH